jgi:hypothetical protein
MQPKQASSTADTNRRLHCHLPCAAQLAVDGCPNPCENVNGIAFIESLRILAHFDRMVRDRRAHRYFVLKAGTIAFGGNVIDCVVRNLSISGAALEAPNQCGIPSRFVLAIPGDGLRLACRVKWRKEHRIGVQFG